MTRVENLYGCIPPAELAAHRAAVEAAATKRDEGMARANQEHRAARAKGATAAEAFEASDRIRGEAYRVYQEEVRASHRRHLSPHLQRALEGLR